jgi:hypothetical protein
MFPSDQPIRMIHHLSATGGTVISRCLAAMPDVVLLSELHPLTPSMVPFYPLDPLGQVAWNYAHLLPSDERMYSLFRERLEPVVDLCRIHGKRLVLRDHSHSDYLSERAPGTRLADALRGRYALRQVVTIRNPIDAWLSMVENGFNHHLSGFEQYCERCNRFLDDYSDVPVWRYEDFVAEPDQVMASICEELDLVFLPGFAERAADVVLTGDSGRRPPNIRVLQRREVSTDFILRAVSLESYRSISDRFNYDNAM